jgi:hypothetical protein
MPRSIPVLGLLVALALAGCDDQAPVSPPETPSAAHHGAAHNRNPDRSPDLNRQLVQLRQATARFHNFEKAVDAGYGIPITPCWESRSQGAMGYHYGNPSLLFDEGTVSLLEPEALMYEPGPGGQMRFVGLEYIVFIDQWEAVHGEGADPPVLLGRAFHPHSFLPIYKLHIWLWRDNPRGTFADWNPKVSCRHADDVEYFD